MTFYTPVFRHSFIRRPVALTAPGAPMPFFQRRWFLFLVGACTAACPTPITGPTRMTVTNDDEVEQDGDEEDDSTEDMNILPGGCHRRI